MSVAIGPRRRGAAPRNLTDSSRDQQNRCDAPLCRPPRPSRRSRAALASQLSPITEEHDAALRRQSSGADAGSGADEHNMDLSARRALTVRHRQLADELTTTRQAGRKPARPYGEAVVVRR